MRRALPFVLLLLVSTSTIAGPIRDRLAQRRAAAANEELDERDTPSAAELPPGVRVVRDVAYGPDPAQRFDVYTTAKAHDAPVLFLVHGGGWRHGDKNGRNIVAQKVSHWVPRGYVFITINYRLLPTPVATQAKDVAAALAAAQKRAAEWGGDPARFVLMGHSAGAHLVALVASSPTLARDAGAKPWLGCISLDSAVLDVTPLMQQWHLRLYDDAFGSDPAQWRPVSPFYVLNRKTPPFLLVCSSRRKDSCPQADRFAAKAKSFGTAASVLPEDLTHAEINGELGGASAYTSAVDAFLRQVGAVPK